MTAKFATLPKLQVVTRELKEIQDIVKSDDLNEVDVRLNVHTRGWCVMYGDPGFDQDHSGYWGASTINTGMTQEELQLVANDLLDQVETAIAEDRT